jgi:cell division protein WhiA
VTLAEDVRNELAAIAPARRCDALAEISALFHTAGSLHLRGHGELAFQLDVSASSVARRAFSLLRDLGVESEIRTYRQRAFDRATRYQLHVLGGPRTVEVLREAGIVGRGGRPLTRPPARVVGRPCCRAAYARGALLGAGSVSGPRAAQLEVRFAETDGAEFLVRIAAQEDVLLRARERRNYAVAFAHGAEMVADMLALAGASDAALVIDEHAVVGAARATANRLANADHANLVRTSRAAQEQLRAVHELEERGALVALPDELQEIAALRVKHPALSFRELAAKCEPRVTKAAVQRRLARLVQLAEG